MKSLTAGLADDTADPNLCRQKTKLSNILFTLIVTGGFVYSVNKFDPSSWSWIEVSAGSGIGKVRARDADPGGQIDLPHGYDWRLTVGKTSIVNKFVRDGFDPTIRTTTIYTEKCCLSASHGQFCM
jgi:hypothetical protein